MINPHKIMKTIKNKLKYLVMTHLGRIILAAILCVIGGIFSEYSTIEFLSTDYAIFTYIVAAGCLIIVAEFVWMSFYLLYWLFNKWGS